MASLGELACSYAALVLHDDGIPITSEKISTLVNAANLTIDSFWATLFAKLLEKRNVDDLILRLGSGGGAAAPVAVSSAPTTASGASPAAAPAVEEKKVRTLLFSVCTVNCYHEPMEESDEDMGFSLFD